MTTTTSLSTSANRDQLTTLLDHTAQRSQQRCCFLLRVRPERLAEYIEVHQHVWQDMRDALSNAGWRRYSLFLRPEDGLVVGYFESDDTAAATRALEDEDGDTRGQTEMAEFIVQPSGGTPEILAQYFYLA